MFNKSVISKTHAMLESDGSLREITRQAHHSIEFPEITFSWTKVQEMDQNPVSLRKVHVNI